MVGWTAPSIAHMKRMFLSCAAGFVLACGPSSPVQPVPGGDDAGAPMGDASPPTGDAAPPDAGVGDAGPVDPGPPLAPRLIGPLSTMRATSRRPTLHWKLAGGATGAHVEVCADHACNTVLTTFDAQGTSGAPSVDLPPGVVFWRAYGTGGGVTTAKASPPWELVIPPVSAPVDTAWGTMLDVDGDGLAELAVGAPDDAGWVGKVYVYMGSHDGPSGSSTIQSLTGIDGNGAGYAMSVSSAGDVDGDGYADLAVGAETLDEVYVYRGNALTLPGKPSYTLQGIHPTAIGDVDGDGYGDLALQGPNDALYLYPGSASGPPKAPTVLPAPQGAQGFAHEIAGGDINGDGYGDLLVADFKPHPDLYVYLGGPGGLPSAPSATIASPVWLGLVPTGAFGFNQIGTGDVNGDGYADVVTLGHHDDTSIDCPVYLFRGGSSGLASTPDADTPLATGCHVSQMYLASSGDVNGDGYADAVVSLPSGLQTKGVAYVFDGSSSGLPASPTSTFEPFPGFTYGNAVLSTDINGDGKADPVFGASAYFVRAYMSSGTPLTRTLSGPVSSAFGECGSCLALDPRRARLNPAG